MNCNCSSLHSSNDMAVKLEEEDLVEKVARAELEDPADKAGLVIAAEQVVAVEQVVANDLAVPIRNLNGLNRP